MSSVDERVVRMEFDNEKFEAGVRTTMSSLDKLKESLKFKDGAFKNIQESADSLNFSPVTDGIYQVRQNFSMLNEFTRVLFDRIANRAIDLGKTLVSALTINPIRDGFAEYETQMNAVQTIMANTKKEFAGVTEDQQLDAINEALGELNRYADRTIYNFTEMTRNIGTFTAAGVELDDSVAAIQGIANLAAVSGANAHQASNAMYQLSQALSSGVVRLMDWNSVQNASMGGQFFQDALQKTADEFIETGRQVENAAGQMVSYRDATGITAASIEDLIAQEGSFRNSLQKGWLTSDVLLETLAKLTDVGLADYFSRVTGVEADWIKTQFDAIDAAEDQDAAIAELAKTLADTGQIGEDVARGYIEQMFLAQDAATKVKTFTQLIDTLKEALGSGWTQSIQYIVGDFKEAMELWTAVNDELSAIINNAGETRNAILKIWHDSDEAGSGGRADALQAIADIYFGIKAAVLSAKEAFEDFFGSPTIEESADRLKQLTQGFSNFATSLRGFLESEEFTGRLQGALGGVFSIAKGLRSIAGKVLNRLSPLIDGVSEFAWHVFTAADSLGRLITYFMEASNKFSTLKSMFIDGTTQSKRFKTFLTELCLAIDAVVASILKVLGIDVEGTPVTDFFTNLGEFFQKHIDLSIFDALIEKLPTLSSLFEKAKGVLSDLGGAASYALEVFGGFVGDVFGSVLDWINSLFHDNETDSEEVTTFADNVVKAFDIIKGAVSDLFGFIETVAPGIGEGFKTMFEYLSSDDFRGLLDNLALITGGGLLVALTNLANTVNDTVAGAPENARHGLVDVIKTIIDTFVGDVTEQFSGAVDTFTSSMESIAESLADMAHAVNTTDLLKISVSILMLVHAVSILSNLDRSGAANGIAGVVVLMGGLLGAMASLSEISFAAKPAISQLLKFSVAMIIMAHAVDIMSGIDSDTALSSASGLSLLMLVMSRALNNLRTTDKNSRMAVTGVLALSIAVGILARSVRYLSDLDMGELTRGLYGVGLLLLGLGLFARAVNGMKSSMSSVASILAVVIAIRLIDNSVQELSAMHWEDLTRGLLGVIAIIGSVGLFVRFLNGMKVSLGSLLAIVAIVAAIKILSETVNEFASMDNAALEQGIVSVGVLLLAIAAAVAVISRFSVSLSSLLAVIVAAGAIVVIAESIRTLSEVMGELGSLDPEALDQGMQGLATAMLALLVPLVLIGQSSARMLIGAVAIVAIAGAINLLVPAIEALGAMSRENLIQGLLAIVTGVAIVAATMIGMAGAIALSSKILSASAASIIIASVALAVFGGSLYVVGVGLGKVTEALGSFISTLAPVVAAIIGAVGVLGVGISSLIDGLFSGLSQIETPPPIDLSGIFAAISEAIHAAGDFIMTELPYIIGVVGSFLNTLFSFLPTLIPTFLAFVGTFVIALLQAIVTWIPAISDALISAVITLVNSVANGIRTHGPEILSAVANIASAIVEIVLLAIEDLVRLIPGFGDALGDQLASARGAISEAFSAGDMQQTMQDTMVGAQQGVENGTGAVVNAAGEVGTEARSAVEESLGDGTEVTGPYMEELASGFSLDGVDLSAFTGSLSDTLTIDLSGAANSTVESYTSPFNVNASELPVAGLPEDLVGILGSYDSDYSATGLQSITSYTDSIGSPSAASAATSNASAVASAGVSGVGSQQAGFVNTGGNAGRGFGNGMANTTGYVRTIASNLAAAALASMNATLQVASPSRKAMKTGRYTGEGFAIGLSQLVPYVENQAARLGGGALDGLRESMKHVGDILDSDMDVTPTIRPVLDLSEVQNGVSAIGGMLDGRSYGMPASISAGDYALNSIGSIAGRRSAGDRAVNYTVNINGARVNDIPEIQSATYDYLVTLKRYGEM